MVFLETSCHRFEVTGLVSVHFANEMVPKLSVERNQWATFKRNPSHYGAMGRLYIDLLIYHENQPNVGEYTKIYRTLILWVILDVCSWGRDIQLISGKSIGCWNIIPFGGNGHGRFPTIFVFSGYGDQSWCKFVVHLRDFPSIHPWSLTARPWKMMVGRLVSYWEGNFWGAMLNFGRVANCLGW